MLIQNTKLEKHNFFIRVFRIITVPLLNLLPERLIRYFMRTSSHDAAVVVAKGGTTHALEAMYTRYHRTIFSRGFFQGIADYFWHHFISQPKALRNRLTMVKEILVNLINETYLGQEQISVLSIAGGSARSVIYALKTLREHTSIDQIRVVVIDKDNSALEIGREISISYGLKDSFEWINGNARDVEKLIPNRTFDIIEIVGLIDYFDEQRAVRLLSLAHGIMNNNGSLIIANVIPNVEMSFVRKTGWPAMRYREIDQIKRLLELSGFKRRNDIMIEPLKVHCIVVAKK